MAGGTTKREMYQWARTWLDGELFDHELESEELEEAKTRIWSVGVTGGSGSRHWTFKLCLEAAFKAGFRRGKGKGAQK